MIVLGILVACTADAAPSQTASPADPVLRLTNRSNVALMRIVVTGVSSVDVVGEMKDAGTSGAIVTFERRETRLDQNTVHVTYLATVAGLSTATALERTAQLRVDRVEIPIKYTLSSKVLGAPKLTYPEEWSVRDGVGALAVTIETPDDPVGKIELHDSTLVEIRSKRALAASELKLCIDKCEGACGAAVLPLTSPQKLLVCPVADAAIVGEYKGSILLKWESRSLLKVGQITVFGTSLTLVRVGAALILLGVVIAMSLKFFLPAVGERLEALIAAQRHARRLGGLAKILRSNETSHANAGQLLDRMNLLIGALSDTALEEQGYLRRFLLPFATSFRQTDLKLFLDRIGLETDAIGVLVHGIQALDGRGLEREETVAAIKRIAATSTEGLTVAQAQDAVMAALPLRNARGGSGPRLEGTAKAADPGRRLVLLGYAGWAILAVVTTISGYATLIADKPGFGSSFDLLNCFLWGLGITVGVSLAASSVAAALGAITLSNRT